MATKSPIAAITFSLILISLLAGLQAVEVAKANWILPPTKPASKLQQ